jgi:hypothetical protein
VGGATWAVNGIADPSLIKLLQRIRLGLNVDLLMPFE